MNAIDGLFEKLRSENRKAFIPFITAGDPSLEATSLLAKEMARQGASMLEIGFPYSDPIADGSVIQASYNRALEKGLKIDDILGWSRRLTQEKGFSLPLIGMVSYSLVHHRGTENFITQLHEAGFCGAIVPDLPLEEAESLAVVAEKKDFRLIFLVTPTTPRERAVRIAKLSTGFLYCVSVTGITGERDRLPDELLEQLRWLKQQTNLPLCVGFGVSKPEHVIMLRDVADGVIVGSAFVRRLEKLETQSPTGLREIGELAQSLVQALDSRN